MKHYFFHGIPRFMILKKQYRGAWVAQSVKHPTSAQVMISQFVSSSPASGSVLTAQSLESPLDPLPYDSFLFFLFFGFFWITL